MGKKYDAYEKAVQAEMQASERYYEASRAGDEAGQQESSTNYAQAHRIAEATWDEFIEDPEG